MDFNQMGEMLQQAQAMQQQMEERLAASIVEADAGGGAVTARMNGKKHLLSVRIAPTAAAGDITLLEDLVVAAVNAAERKADEAQQTSASAMLGGLNLPGL
jgi:DNA-binding YbaB/EbfC family protein